MRRSSVAAAAVTVMVTLGSLLAGAPASAQSSGAKSEVGVSAKTIRVAVVADVDNSIAPGVLQGVVDGVEGWGRYVNANGGIAGRKVQVDFIDSKLNANEARNATINACGEDLALVGTGALLLQTVDDEVNCKDSTGKATGIPDVAALVTNSAEASAPNDVPDRPELGGLRHARGRAADLPVEQRRLQVLREEVRRLARLLRAGERLRFGGADLQHPVPAAQQAGIKSDHDWHVTGFDPQSAYTPIVQAMKTDGSNYGLSLQAVTGVVLERKEATLQGLTDPKILWQCTLACYYDKSFVGAKDDVDREYMTLGFLPFAETGANPMNANFVKYVGKDKLSGFASGASRAACCSSRRRRPRPRRTATTA